MQSYTEDFVKHAKQVMHWLADVKVEKRLYLYLSPSYTRFIITKLQSLFNDCQSKQLLPLFDKECIVNLILLTEYGLSTIFNQWLTIVAQKKEEGELVDGSSLSYKIRYDTKTPMVLRATVSTMLSEKNTRISIQRFRIVERMESIEELITEQEFLYEDTKKAILNFIDSTNLRAYYPSSNTTLQTRVNDILKWLRSCLISRNLSVTMDFTKPYLLRQLLTTESEWTSEKILDKILDHGCVNRVIRGAPHRKRRVYISCKQYRKNDAAFLDQLRDNTLFFNNAVEFSSLLTSHSKKDSSFVDVFLVSLEDNKDIPHGMTIFEKPAYAKIEEKLLSMQRFLAMPDDESGDDVTTSAVFMENQRLKGIETPHPNTKLKRKRRVKESPIIEKIKRIRLVNERGNEMDADSTDVVYQLVSTKLYSKPDFTQDRTCIVCTKSKPYSSFYHKTTYKCTGKEYQNENNICHGCLNAHKNWRYPKQTTDI